MKRNGKKSRKIRKLIITCTLSAVVLIVSTYTWFIGLQTVGVKPFEIEIATTEGLYLSMDGKTWTYDLDVADYMSKAYDGDTNTWATDGLIPISTVGDLDSAVSRLKLYEKASLTTSPGGYRLLASRVDNYTKTTTQVDGKDVTTVAQGDGYVAFDLFIKNLSGNEYYVDNNVLNEEAIYLNLSSSVEVKNTGAADTQLLTGIENSIRVGFAQIGRVIATTTDQKTITGITCSNSTEKDAEGNPIVTGICRNAQIWEPNDTKHVQNALNWYEESCITRKSTGATITNNASYNVATYESGVKKSEATYCYANNGATKTYMAANNNALPTYAISRVIDITDNVDVYDGTEFNTYTANTTTYKNYRTVIDALSAEELAILNSLDSIYDEDLTTAQQAVVNKIKDLKLVNYDYFTDTEKNIVGTSRPTFMTLAPNSITKVRVYIWLEGQDIDNYDFAQLGTTVSIKFGFTKEQLFGTDIDYVGPTGVPVTPETVEVTE